MNKRLIALLFFGCTGSSLEASQSGALLTTFNWPSPLFQPGYQLEVVPADEIYMFATYYGPLGGLTNVFGLNSIQTQGYNASAITQSNALVMKRPVLKNRSQYSCPYLFSWADILHACRSFEREWAILRGSTTYGIQYILLSDGDSSPEETESYPYYIDFINQTGEDISVTNVVYDDSFGDPSESQWWLSVAGWSLGVTMLNWFNYWPLLSSSLIKANGTVMFEGTSIPRIASNVLNYHYPFYENYYTNSLSGSAVGFLNSDAALIQALTPLANLMGHAPEVVAIASDITKPQLSLSLANFASYTLPGSNNAPYGNFFFDLSILNTQNTSQLLGQTFMSSSLTPYQTLARGSVLSSQTNIFYLPLFLTDPGNPYYPMGWNYANTESNFDPAKATLMTNFSSQLSSTQSVCTPGV